MRPNMFREAMLQRWQDDAFRAKIKAGSTLTAELMAEIRARGIPLDEVETFVLGELVKRAKGCSLEANRSRARRLVAACRRKVARDAEVAALRERGKKISYAVKAKLGKRARIRAAEAKARSIMAVARARAAAVIAEAKAYRPADPEHSSAGS